MASLFQLPRPEISKDYEPNDGMLLYFYVNNMAPTLKTTWIDEAKTMPHANPVVSDSDGLWPQIFIEGTYSIRITDKNGVLIYEDDDISEYLTNGDDSQFHVFADLATAVASTLVAIGDEVLLNERTAGKGGGGKWIGVDAAVDIPNTYNIVQSTGVGTVALKLVLDPYTLYSAQWGYQADYVDTSNTGLDNKDVINAMTSWVQTNGTQHTKIVNPKGPAYFSSAPNAFRSYFTIEGVKTRSYSTYLTDLNDVNMGTIWIYSDAATNLVDGGILKNMMLVGNRDTTTNTVNDKGFKGGTAISAINSISQENVIEIKCQYGHNAGAYSERFKNCITAWNVFAGVGATRTDGLPIIFEQCLAEENTNGMYQVTDGNNIEFQSCRFKFPTIISSLTFGALDQTGNTSRVVYNDCVVENYDAINLSPGPTNIQVLKKVGTGVLHFDATNRVIILGNAINDNVAWHGFVFGPPMVTADYENIKYTATDLRLAEVIPIIAAGGQHVISGGSGLVHGFPVIVRFDPDFDGATFDQVTISSKVKRDGSYNIILTNNSGAPTVGITTDVYIYQNVFPVYIVPA